MRTLINTTSGSKGWARVPDDVDLSPEWRPATRLEHVRWVLTSKQISWVELAVGLFVTRVIVDLLGIR